MKMIRFKLFFVVVFIQVCLFSALGQNKLDESYLFSKQIENRLEDPHTNTNLLWSDFLVTIQNYDLWGDIDSSDDEGLDEPFISSWMSTDDLVFFNRDKFYFRIESDTVSFGQEVFTDNIEDKIIKITPLTKNKNIRFKVSAGACDEIKQFLSTEDYGRDSVEDKEALLETWEKVSPYQPAKDSAQYYFKIPYSDSISDIKQIKVDLALSDTTLYYEAEGGGHYLNYIYKGKPAEHRTRGMIIRIQKYNRDVLIETKYIRVSFPEAC